MSSTTVFLFAKMCIYTRWEREVDGMLSPLKDCSGRSRNVLV